MFVVKGFDFNSPVNPTYIYSIYLENGDESAWVKNFPVSHYGSGENSAEVLAHKFADKLNNGEIEQITEGGMFKNIADFFEKLNKMKRCTIGADYVTLTCRGCGVYEISGNVGGGFKLIFFDDEMAVKSREAITKWSKKNKVKFVYRTTVEYKT